MDNFVSKFARLGKARKRNKEHPQLEKLISINIYELNIDLYLPFASILTLFLYIIR